jgi:hypothetical protein
VLFSKKKKKKEEKGYEMHEQFLCDPRVLSITLTQNPVILDGCLNGGLIIGSFGVYDAQ